MFRISVFHLLITTLLLSHLAFANIEDEARQFFEAYNQATGGSEIKKATKTMHMKGTWDMPDKEIRGAADVWIENQNVFALILEVPEVGFIRNCYVNGKTWVEDSTIGVRSLEDTEFKNIGKDSILFPELDLDHLYRSISIQESSDLQKTILRMIDKNGVPETWIFDTKTKMLLETQVLLDSGVRGSFTIKTTYSDYREKDGLIMPYQVIWNTPVYQVIIDVEEIELNCEIPSQILQVPESIDQQ